MLPDYMKPNRREMILSWVFFLRAIKKVIYNYIALRNAQLKIFMKRCIIDVPIAIRMIEIIFKLILPKNCITPKVHSVPNKWILGLMIFLRNHRKMESVQFVQQQKWC